MTTSFPSLLPKFLKEFSTNFHFLTYCLMLSLQKLLQLKVINDLIAKSGLLFSALILCISFAKFDAAPAWGLMPFRASALPVLVLPLCPPFLGPHSVFYSISMSLDFCPWVHLSPPSLSSGAENAFPGRSLLYWCPRAALSNCHEPSGLKYQKFIFSQSGGRWFKVKAVRVGRVPSGGSAGESAPCFRPGLRRLCQPSAFLGLQPPHCPLYLLPHTPSLCVLCVLCISLSVPLYRHLTVNAGPTLSPG